MDKYNHFEYGEMLARALKPIQHTDQKQKYYRATDQNSLYELNEKITTASGMLLVAVDVMTASFDWKNSDSLMEQPSYSFIVAKATQSGDVDSVRLAQEESRTVAKEIIAKMLQDAADLSKPIQYLKPDSFKIEGVGPIADNFYGVMLSFNFEQGMPYMLNPDMWM